jgi:hypothetical protein
VKDVAWFFHMLGLAVWLGAILGMAVCVLGLRSRHISNDVKQVLNKLQGKLTIVGAAGALVMLISGGILLGTSGASPLWVNLMTGIGGAVIIFSLIAITLQSHFLSVRIQSGSFDDILSRQLNLLYVTSWIVMIGIIVVLGIVSARL